MNDNSISLLFCKDYCLIMRWCRLLLFDCIVLFFKHRTVKRFALVPAMEMNSFDFE